MRGLADIHLDVRGGDIVVDLPGTNYTATYHKPAVSPQLLATDLPAKDDPRAKLTLAEFLSRAWRLANDKARELVGSRRRLDHPSKLDCLRHSGRCERSVRQLAN
jgi:hypothetical protein